MTPISTSGSTGASPGSRPRWGSDLALLSPEPLCENEIPVSSRARTGVEVDPMPLSEDEQRILQEIEAQFYANDPQLAQQVSETTLYRHSARNIKWAALGFVVGFVVLLTSFASP